MNETQKTKPVRRMRQWLLIWLISYVLFTVVTGIIVLITDHMPNKLPGIEWALIFGALCASVLVGLLAFIRWVIRWIGCWRNLRYVLVGIAILATLIAIFYTEEDWRGKRAWENYKQQLEAQGVVLDWDNFIPPPVPDDENFYTASTNIFLRFQRIPEDHTNEIEAATQLRWLNLFITPSNSFPILDTSTSPPPAIANLVVSSPINIGRGQATNTLAVTLGADDATKKVQDLIRAAVGQGIDGAQGFKFSERRLTDIQPVQIFVQTQTTPSVSDLENLLPANTITNIGHLRITTTANQNVFRVSLVGVRITSAADYLKWSDQYVPAFDEIREALKRPCAILPGDYSQPYLMPIPNFVTMRALAQTLAQRAQCYLLLGELDKALHELTLVHDVCRILEKPPAGKPETLLEAMINVAITSLYTQIIAEGMQQHAWQEPQLAAFQEQLGEINLPFFVSDALQTEPAAECHDAEIIPPQKWLDMVGWKTHFHLGLWLMPRGWVYQNMVVSTRLEELSKDICDSANGTIFPQKVDAAMRKRQTALAHHHSPFYLFADIAIPNVTKAWQTTAHNQTIVNEARIACALERCRLVHGEYPDSLDALVPGYLRAIPQDIIDGQPLHYRRTDDGKFLLYSIGWSERDDGGKKHEYNNIGRGVDYSRGNWVWPN